jgi:hypothetical protein
MRPSPSAWCTAWYQAHCKRLALKGIAPQAEREASVDLLTRLWASAEAREGLSAFLDKRKPHWQDGGDQ